MALGGQALVLLKQGQLESLSVCNEAIDRGLHSAAIYCTLGDVFKAKQNLQGALAAYAESLRIDSHSAGAAITLDRRAGVLLKLKLDIDGALNDLDAALQIDPEHNTAHYNRGHILWEKGNETAAGEAYDRGLQLNPNYIQAC